MHMRVDRDQLELDAALEVGRIIFEFSRLDFDLWLTLINSKVSGPDRRVEKEFASRPFSDKLDAVKALFERELAGQPKRLQAGRKWINRADFVRELRNFFAHGRWIPDGPGRAVTNVVVSPKTGEQEAQVYTLDQLAAVRQELVMLERDLRELRKGWQL